MTPLIAVAIVVGFFLATFFLGRFNAQGKPGAGAVALIGTVLGAILITHTILLPYPKPVMSYLRHEKSVLALAVFSEPDSIGHAQQKVLIKDGAAYRVLVLPELVNFDSKRNAYKVDAGIDHRAGLVKIETIPSDMGPDLIWVRFRPGLNSFETR